MKIICINRHDGLDELTIKPDTALLVNNKPLFIPHFTNDLRCTPCLLLRISRLGRNIESRFASRYYDAIAIGLDFVAYDKVAESRAKGMSLDTWIGFDGSMAIGKWSDRLGNMTLIHNGQAVINIGQYVCSPDDAIAKASQYFKLGTGDIIAIAAETEPIRMDIDDHVEIMSQDSELPLLAMNIK